MGARQFLQLSGFTKADRIQMTDRVSEAINQAGAWIIDFHLYSNLLICINFEVPLANITKLAARLQETGLHLSQESLEQLIPTHDSNLNGCSPIGNYTETRFLQETGFLTPQETESLAPRDLKWDTPTLNDQELAGTLQITFIHNQPDLIREVPAVPG